MSANYRVSVYEEAWQRLRGSGELSIQPNFDEDATEEEKKAAFLRIREGITKRKCEDTQYRETNPAAKIKVVERNYVDNYMILKIFYVAGHFTLSDL